MECWGYFLKNWKYMKTLTTVITSVMAATMLAACGGGGGSGGTYAAPYEITLRAEKPQLPVNVNNIEAGAGVFAPFTTVLYVEAKTGGRPIPSGTFACNVAGGLDSGTLYKLDGSDETETIDGVERLKGGYRNLTLEANSGGSSFHFHALNQAGTSRITCTIPDERDGMLRSASVDITVGGGAGTGKPSHMRVVPEGAWNGYLGTQGNTKRVPNAQVMQVLVLDDLNQPVRTGGRQNVQVRILPNSEAAAGARLVAGHASSTAGSGTVLQLSAIQSVASFSVISGAQTGPILLEYTADRHDNDVTNGIQDPMIKIDRVDVIQEITEPLRIEESEVVEMTNTVPFSYLLTAQDGLPPYNWAVTGLPRGLSLDANLGVISGTPNDRAGEYLVWLTVWDKNRKEAKGSVRFKVHEAIKPEDFAISGCTHLANVEDTCHIGTAVTQLNFAYAFTSSVQGVTWEFSGTPAWLNVNQGVGNGRSGVIGGTPQCSDVGVHRFFVTATKSGNTTGVGDTSTSVTRPVAISVIRGNGC